MTPRLRLLLKLILVDQLIDFTPLISFKSQYIIPSFLPPLRFSRMTENNNSTAVSSSSSSLSFLYENIPVLPLLSSSSTSSSTSSSSSSSLPTSIRQLKQCRKTLHKLLNTATLTSIPKPPLELINLAVQILSLDEDNPSFSSASLSSSSSTTKNNNNHNDSLPSFIDTKECALDLLVTLSILYTSDGNTLIPLITDALANYADTGFEKTFVSLAQLDFETAEPLERNLLILLIRLMGYQVFTAGDLLDMCNGLVTVALDSIIAVFRWYQLTNNPTLSTNNSYSSLQQDQFEIFITTIRLFHELTVPGTYFRTLGTGNSEGLTSAVLVSDQIVDTNALPIDKLTAIFRNQINILINHSLEHPLFESIITLIKPWITKHTTGKTVLRQSVHSGIALHGSTGSDMDAQSHQFMNYLIRTCQNLLLFSSEYGNKLRQHLAVSSGIMNECILPYTRMCITAIGTVYDALQIKTTESLGKDCDIPLYNTILLQLISSLRSSITLLSIACFKIRILRPLLRDGVLLTSALQNKYIINDIYCVTGIIQLAVNADILVKVDTNNKDGSSNSSTGTKVGKSGIKKKMFGPVESPGGKNTNGKGSEGFSSSASPTVQSHVNYALLALISDAVQQHDDENRIRIARRIQESEDHAVPMVNNGTSYDLLKEFWLIDTRREINTSSSTTVHENVGVSDTPLVTKTSKDAEIRHSDSKEEKEITTTFVSTSSSSTVPTVAAPIVTPGLSLTPPLIQARAPYHLPPLRRPNIPSMNNTTVPPRPEADFFAPRCALTGNLLTDPVIILVPRSNVPETTSSTISTITNVVNHNDTPPYTRKPAPGSYTLPYNSKKIPIASESKQTEESKENSCGDSRYLAIYCEREAVDDTEEEDDDGESNQGKTKKYNPFTGEIYSGYVELAKDDPVLSSVQQWQLRRLMGGK